MRPRQKRILPVCLWAIPGVLIIVLWRALFPAEPVYDGKSLASWARQFGSNYWRGGGNPVAREAQAAIRRIGTNGIPFLLDMLRVEESPLQERLRQVAPQRWHRTLRLVDRSGEIRRVGAYGLAALGTNAPGAVQDLIEIATHHPDEDGRYIAGFALRNLGSAAEPAIPVLIQRLTNSVRIIRDDAAIGLAQIGRRPDLAVPALVRYLESVRGSSGWEVTDAVAAIGRFGTDARPAASLMIGFLDHPDSAVRREVTNWLPRVDPKAAIEAGVARQIVPQP